MSDANVNQFRPQTVDYNERDEARLSWGPVLKEGLFKTAITKANSDAETDGNHELYLGVTLAPLDKTDTPVTTTVRKRIYLPLTNPVTGTAPEDMDEVKKRFASFVQAIDPTAFKGIPQISKGDDGVWRNGAEVMTKEMWATYNKQKGKVLLERAKTWYNNPQILIGAVCYTFVKRNEQYANVFYMASSPGDKPVITENFTG